MEVTGWSLIFTAVIAGLAQGQSTGEEASASAPGLSKYWSGNYKDFEQIYGRTSDLELYGKTLPLTVTFGSEESDFKKLKQYQNKDDTSASDTKQQPYEIPKFYQHTQAARKKIKTKPKSTSYGQVITSEEAEEYKSPSVADPYTIEYLKRYHNLEALQSVDFPHEIINSFKPYQSFQYAANPNLFDSYKSIQEIIDSNDSQEEPIADIKKPIDFDSIQKIKYDGFVKALPARGKGLKNNKPKPVYPKGSSKKASRPCTRCRKSPPRPRLMIRKVRPRVTKVKHRYVSLSD